MKGATLIKVPNKYIFLNQYGLSHFAIEASTNDHFTYVAALSVIGSDTGSL